MIENYKNLLNKELPYKKLLFVIVGISAILIIGFILVNHNKQMVTLLLPPPTVVDYIDMDVAVVYYDITDDGLAKMQNGLKLAREFYWRNSGLRLNLNLTYIPINEIVSPDSDSIGDSTIEKAIADAGYQISDFGGIFHISTDVDGTWCWGIYGNFDIGLCHSACVPCSGGCYIPTGVVYPGNDPSIDYKVIWVFTHEFQHTLDAMYYRNDYPEMFNGDQPEAYAVRGGEQFSYQAEGLRRFNNWLHFDYVNKWEVAWGSLKQFVDNNGNGIPDNDPGLPIDDVRLGPDWNKEKYMAGIYQGSLTGSLYDIPSKINKFSPMVDGDIENGYTFLTNKEMYDNIDVSFNTYSVWDTNNIYLAGTVNKPAKLHLWLDMDGDGWWNGRNNLEILYDISTDNVTTAHVADFSDETREHRCTHLNAHMKDDGLCDGMWDDESGYPYGRIIAPADIVKARNLSAGIYSFEIKIPTIALTETQEIGYRIVFESGGNRATVFEDYELIYRTLLRFPCDSFGDIDDDGFVTEYDSQMVLDYVAGSLTLTEEQKRRADVDWDGDVDSVDSTFILRYTQGLIDTFSVCTKDTDNDGVPDYVDLDDDNDGFNDDKERYIGTDPLDACSDNTSDPAWPFDINNDTKVNVGDILKFSAEGVLLTKEGDPKFNRRYDLNADRKVNVGDILLYPAKNVLLTKCSN